MTKFSTQAVGMLVVLGLLCGCKQEGTAQPDLSPAALSATCAAKYGPPADAFTRQVVIVVDQSSPFDTAFIDRSVSAVDDLLGFGDRLTLIAFAGQANGGLPREVVQLDASHQWPVRREDFPPAQRGKAQCNDNEKARIRQELAEALSSALQNTQNRKDGHSNILFTLSSIAGNLKRANPNLLIVFSDGMEHGGSGAISFYTPTGAMRAFDPEDALSEVQNLGLLPDLSAVGLVWSGLGMVASDGPMRTTQELSRLQAFWQGYARQSGADLHGLSFGPPMLFASPS